MSLLSLPVDALELIFKWIDIESLAKLHQIGNRVLHYRSVVGKAVRDVTVDLSQYKLNYELKAQPSKFRSLKTISQLTPLSIYPSIEYLTLDFSGHSATVDSVEAILALNLRELTLRAANAWNLFVEPNGQVRSLQASFRRLTSLIVEDMKPIDTRVSTDSVMDQIGKQLPRSLTRLHLSTFSRTPQALLDRLPPHIVDLLLATMAATAITRFAYGKDLTKVSFIQQMPATAETLKKLPQSLLSLTIRPTRRQLINEATARSILPSEIIEWLPGSLTSLIVPTETGWGSHIASLLPRNLTELDARRWSISDEAVSRLPDSLTRLCIKGSLSASEAVYSSMPRKLTSLQCGFPIDSPSAISSLPPTMTKLHLWTAPPADIEKYCPPNITNVSFSSRSVSFKHLSPKLRTFCFDKCTHPERLIDLPSGIKKLKLGVLADTKEESGEAWSAPHGWSLPSTLTTLIAVEGVSFNDRILALLPPTLTKLHVANETPTVTTRGLAYLPPSLTYCFFYSIELTEHTTALIPTLDSYQKDRSFELEQLVDLTRTLLPRSITTRPCLFYTCNLSPSFCESLPRDLCSLSLNITLKMIDTSLGVGYREDSAHRVCLRNSAPTRESMAKLPPTLTRLHSAPHPLLHSDYDHSIFGDTFTELPTSLTDLEIRWRWRDTSALWFQRLPSLTRLVIPLRQDLTELGHCKAFSCIPASVKELCLTACVLTEAQFPSLPAGLTSLSARSCNYTTHPIKSLVGPYLATLDAKTTRLAPFERLPRFLTKLALSAEPRVELAGPCTVLLRSTLPFVPIAAFGVAKANQVKLFIEHWDEFTQAWSDKTPDVITDISLSDATVHDDFFRRLSPSVTRVALLHNYNITTMSIPQWPKSLTRIELTTLNFSARDLKEIPADLKVFDWAFLHSHLKAKSPSGLTDLIVEQQGTSMTGDWLNALPKTLETIHLPAHQNLQDSAIKSLPPNLLALILPLNNRLSGACIPFLPRTLTTLVLPNLVITEKSVGQLPPVLTHLDLSSIHLPPSCVPLLPKQLVHLNLSNTSLPDTSLEHIPTGLKFLRLRQIHITGSLAASFPEDSEVSLTTLIAAASARLPKTLEVSPCLEWRLETPPSFLQKLHDSPATSFNFPGASVETWNALTKPKPGVFYRVLASHGSLVPPTTIDTKLFSKTITYKLVDPSPPACFQESTHASKPQLLTVFWMMSREDITQPIAVSWRKVQSLKLQNLYNILPPALQDLPPTLTALHLPHSRKLDIRCLSALPKSITDLHLDLEDDGNAMGVRTKSNGVQVPFIIPFLPPNITRLVLGPDIFIGIDTADLHVPPPQDEEEEPPLDSYSF